MICASGAHCTHLVQLLFHPFVVQFVNELEASELNCSLSEREHEKFDGAINNKKNDELRTSLKTNEWGQKQDNEAIFFLKFERIFKKIILYLQWRYYGFLPQGHMYVIYIN